MPLFSRLFSCIALLVALGGCTHVTPTDVGPTYVAPADSGPTIIDGISYWYVAAPARQEEITAGFPKLKVGQSREDVRQAIGAPDDASPEYGEKNAGSFSGWYYMYRIRMRGTPHEGWMSNVCVDVFFNAGGKLTWADPENIAGLSEVGSPYHR